MRCKFVPQALDGNHHFNPPFLKAVVLELAKQQIIQTGWPVGHRGEGPASEDSEPFRK